MTLISYLFSLHDMSTFQYSMTERLKYFYVFTYQLMNVGNILLFTVFSDGCISTSLFIDNYASALPLEHVRNCVGDFAKGLSASLPMLFYPFYTSNCNLQTASVRLAGPRHNIDQHFFNCIFRVTESLSSYPL